LRASECPLRTGLVSTYKSRHAGSRDSTRMDPGDAIDISDLVYLVDYMFTGGPAPVCPEEANVDASCCASGTYETLSDIDISDLVYLVDYMFTEGPPPIDCP
ncbi:MAG: hypothetical protein KAW61_04365, partial [candidate division Zixibacteria bacterium]|nr:hypothetical protein [candidate division Zixibacteria bacterium]